MVLSYMPTLSAEELTFEVDAGAFPAASQDSAFRWNRLQQMAGTGPVLPVTVLLPPDVSGIDSIEVFRRDCEGPPVASGTARTLISLQDGAVMKPHFPASAGLVRGYEARPIMAEGDGRMLPLLLFPLEVNPEDGATRFCRHLVVKVDYSRTHRLAPARGHYLPGRYTGHVLNPESLDEWYEEWREEGPTYDYVIVARESYINDSFKLPAFVEFKASQGFSPLLISLEEIEAELADPTLERPELLRGWLQAHYKDYGIKYLMIIGGSDPSEDNAIPMKTCWPSEGWEEGDASVPTDMYYADLTGNWNLDGDEHYCELEDYVEVLEEGEEPTPGGLVGGVDLTPEILVGRIPHYGALTFYADGILKRLMIYEQSPPAKWHNRVLFPSPMVAFPDGNYVDGSLVSEYVVEKSLGANGYGHTILGEWIGNLTTANPGVAALNLDSMIEYWNEGYGAVFWCAHGNSEGAYRNTWFIDTNKDGLPQQEECQGPAFVKDYSHQEMVDDFPPLVFHASCLNAQPEEHGNLAHTLLRHASVANVASTRITMGLAAGDTEWAPSPFSPGGFTLGVYFIHAAVVQRTSVAEAFYNAQNALAFGVQPWTFKVRLEFNLFSDPSLTLPGCDSDDLCDDGDWCNGTEICVDGGCQSGQPVVCETEVELGPCQKVACIGEDGCVVTELDNYVDCDDDNKCTKGSYCLYGECLTGTPVQCSTPSAPCYTSECNPATGQCLNEPVADGEACLEVGQPGECEAGECVPLEETVAEQPSPEVVEEVVSSEANVAEAEPSPQPGGGCSTGASSSPLAQALLLLLLLSVLHPIRAVLRCNAREVRGHSWTRSSTKNS